MEKSNTQDDKINVAAATSKGSSYHPQFCRSDGHWTKYGSKVKGDKKYTDKVGVTEKGHVSYFAP